MASRIPVKRWVTEHKTLKGEWVWCNCSMSRLGIVRSNLEHRFREMIIKRVKRTEWV